MKTLMWTAAMAVGLWGVARALTGQEIVGDRTALFDGNSLDGWQVIRCEAVVDHGEILVKSGDGFVQTKAKYGDYIFEWDWKPLKKDKWDGGVFFRFDETEPSRPWPQRYLVILKEGDEGNVELLKGAKSTGLIKPGDWNHFKLTVRGTKVEMEINGKPAWKSHGLGVVRDGPLALQAKVAAGGPCRFRNVFITELK